MKKSLIIVALAMALVFAFASSAMAYGLGGFPANDNYYGYLSWGWAQDQMPAGTNSPHGNYTTSTYKCAVCHSVHKADADGVVLTAWPGNSYDGTNMAPYQSCTWCHGTSTPLFAESGIAMGSTLSPHGYCGRCHTSSPHGGGGSAYPVLSARLINTGGDSAIATDTANGANNLTAVDFNDVSDTGALTLGTGYLCGECHDSTALALPVNEAGATPAISGTATSTVTGHRVLAMATSDWNDDSSYGAWYSASVNGPIAFNSVANPTASGCKSCHDALMADGVNAAFPHNYVDNAGTPVAKNDAGLTQSYIWLTVAGDADDARTVSEKTTTASGDPLAGAVDGLCLKCHLSGDRSSGVGVTW